MKIVLDTNVLISALLSPKSNIGKIFEAWQNEKYNLCFSEDLLAEISRVLSYPKIKKRLGFSDLEIRNYCSLLKFKGLLFDIKHIKASVPKDQKDNHVLATFLASKADYLISGDDDLLSLSKKYKILSPKEFVDKFL